MENMEETERTKFEPVQTMAELTSGKELFTAEDWAALCADLWLTCSWGWNTLRRAVSA